ncbi:OLC1v1017244C1 [Oldenlandia corymbosa var. corymbosa]|uniref:OLC1v1017244C1 n=1 Tax=Oldenlandia corymbosa var. corymbosa TaxID=529605 RepID=A0AAV1E8Z3_OLDCO|nr:OLC1v1017244C1 [Oldenlandia corymbosa var. corymbosa]
MNSKAMNLLYGIHGKNKHHKLRKNLHNNIDEFQFVIIRMPSTWVLKLTTPALFLALVIVSLPWLNTTISDVVMAASAADKVSGDHVSDSGSSSSSSDPINSELFPALFHDLANEGLLKMGNRALVVTNGGEEEADTIFKTRVITDFKMDMISFSYSENQENLISDETYDFMFVADFLSSSDLIERTLKKDGVVAFQLSDNPAVSFQKLSNYKIVYLRGFDSTVVALKKMTNRRRTPNPSSSGGKSTARRLLGLTTEVKKKALNNLEDVLLEPPRAASGKSSTYRKRTRYLPDLIGFSLESYPRRVFIDVGLPDKNDGDSSWFSKNYPTKNTKFDMYKIETVTEEPSEKEVAEIGMSDWLRKNVKENEYVVMKAEAEVVEDLVRSKAINLVDELFLECKHRGIKKGIQRSRRAYWECLALYGSLRDEGIAVHQWWG